MGNKLIRCKVCGRPYEACYSCEKDRGWRMHTDTAEHYQILCILMDYKIHKDAECAYQALKKIGVDLNDTSGYEPSVTVLFEEISKSHDGNEEKSDNPNALTANMERQIRYSTKRYAKSRKDEKKEG